MPNIMHPGATPYSPPQTAPSAISAADEGMKILDGGAPDTGFWITADGGDAEGSQPSTLTIDGEITEGGP